MRFISSSFVFNSNSTLTDYPAPIWMLPAQEFHSGNQWCGRHNCDDTRWRSWLRHCDASQKVAGSTPNGVTVIFHSHNPSGGTNDSGGDSSSNINEYREYFPGKGGKGGRCVCLTTLPPPCADCREIWEPIPPGTFRACPGIALLLSLPFNRF